MSPLHISIAMYIFVTDYLSLSLSLSMMYVFVMNLVFTEPVQGSSIEFSWECVTTRHRRGELEKKITAGKWMG